MLIASALTRICILLNNSWSYNAYYNETECDGSGVGHSATASTLLSKLPQLFPGGGVGGGASPFNSSITANHSGINYTPAEYAYQPDNYDTSGSYRDSLGNVIDLNAKYLINTNCMNSAKVASQPLNNHHHYTIHTSSRTSHSLPSYLSCSLTNHLLPNRNKDVTVSIFSSGYDLSRTVDSILHLLYTLCSLVQ